MKKLLHPSWFCSLLMLVSAPVLPGQQSEPTAQSAISASTSRSNAAPKSSYVGTSPTPTIKAKATPEPADYVIGEQDVLNISVWKEPDLSGPALVRPDGKITLPLLNDIEVVGLTTKQLQELLTEKLKPYVTVPQVTVTPRDINSRKVYVIGQVAHEGAIAINSSTTVLQLIAEVGGLRDFAKRKKIYVMRNQNGKQLRYPFNYDEVIQGKSMNLNIVLEPGDTVVVP